MRNAFYASLVHHGLRGGAVYVSEDAITYQNQTAAIEAKYKHLVLPFREIREISCERVLLLPAVTVSLKNEESYRFIIFNRKRFLNCLDI